MFTAGREWRGCEWAGKHFSFRQEIILHGIEKSLAFAPDYIHSVNKDTEH